MIHLQVCYWLKIHNHLVQVTQSDDCPGAHFRKKTTIVFMRDDACLTPRACLSTGLCHWKHVTGWTNTTGNVAVGFSLRCKRIIKVADLLKS